MLLNTRVPCQAGSSHLQYLGVDTYTCCILKLHLFCEYLLYLLEWPIFIVEKRKLYPPL